MSVSLSCHFSLMALSSHVTSSTNQKKIIWIAVGVLVAVLSTAEGGSKCPPRTKISPCVCHEIIQTEKIFTIVTCSKFEYGPDLLDVPRVLDRMMIDRLVLEDFNKSSFQALTLPREWFANIRFRELEIYNVKLSGTVGEYSSFSGQESTLVKVSLQRSIDSSQDRYVPGSFDLSVLAGAKNIRELDLSWNQFKSVKDNSFPHLEDLQIINLSHNKISSIGGVAFRGLPKLHKIDLSHNKITTLMWNMFQSQISTMDFSYNEISSVPANMFNNMTVGSQSRIMFAHNDLKDLPVDPWLQAFKIASTVDVSDNFFICNCNISWIKNEVKSLSNVIGSCANPGEVELQSLRDFALRESCTSLQ